MHSDSDTSQSELTWNMGKMAVVSAREGTEIAVKELEELCQRSLADYKRPKRILVWAELPIGATGKVQRRSVRERLEAEAAAGAT